MSKPVTHVLILLDRSCSMLGVAEGVRSGINTYVEALGADAEREYRLTMAAFCEKYTLICADARPDEVPTLDADIYRPGSGNTALLDAIGRMFDDFADAVPTLGERDKVLCVIATDGSDNWSTSHSPDDIAKLVTEREEGRWTFIHLSADPATEATHTLGLKRVLSITKADLARRNTYDGMGRATQAFHDGESSRDITDLLRQAVASDERLS